MRICIYSRQAVDRGFQYTRLSLCRAFSACSSFFALPRAALRAETGPSLALGFFDVAPSALEREHEAIKGLIQDPGLNPRQPEAKALAGAPGERLLLRRSVAALQQPAAISSVDSQHKRKSGSRELISPHFGQQAKNLDVEPNKRHR
jgi:hypothetical protein